MSEWVKGQQRESGGSEASVVGDAEKECPRKERLVVRRSVVAVNKQEKSQVNVGVRDNAAGKRGWYGESRRLCLHLLTAPGVA